MSNVIDYFQKLRDADETSATWIRVEIEEEGSESAARLSVWHDLLECKRKFGIQYFGQRKASNG